jgi:hypothetical protein
MHQFVLASAPSHHTFVFAARAFYNYFFHKPNSCFVHLERMWLHYLAQPLKPA